MSDDLKSLSVVYPFLPVDETLISNLSVYKTLTSAIKDLRLVITLPKTFTLPTANQHNIRVFLKKIYLMAAVYYADFTYQVDGVTNQLLEEVPVGSTDHVPNTDSYVLYSGTMTELADGGTVYEVHPDCLIFMQEAPGLFMQGAPITTESDIRDGYNTTVTMTGDSLVFYAAAGIGLGRLSLSINDDVSAWYSIENKASVQGKGMLSINGITGNVHMSATGTTFIQINGNTITFQQVAQ